MPHLDIQYTANIAADTDMTGLCQTLLATLVALRNEADEPVFPLNGTRVMAWPAAHFAVADGQPDRAFIYMNLRIKQGRSDAIKKKAGDAVLAAALAYLESVFAKHPLGLTLEVDEGAHIFEGKRNNLADYTGG